MCSSQIRYTYLHLSCKSDTAYEFCKFVSPSGEGCQFEWKRAKWNITMQGCQGLEDRKSSTQAKHARASVLCSSPNGSACMDLCRHALLLCLCFPSSLFFFSLVTRFFVILVIYNLNCYFFWEPPSSTVVEVQHLNQMMKKEYKHNCNLPFLLRLKSP